MLDEINTKDDRFLAKINLAALVKVEWKTVNSVPVGTDDVEVTLDYSPVAKFLEDYIKVGNSGDISFIRPESIPEADTIRELVEYKVRCGIGSGYIGMDDFYIVKIHVREWDELKKAISKAKEEKRPY